jgi:hypothetical protein
VRRQAPLRTVALAALGGAILALVIALGPKLGAGGLTSPETEIITRLKQTESDGLTIPLGHGFPPLVVDRHHFDRIVVSVAPVERKGRAVSTLDLDGKVGTTEVSSLGLERTPFEARDGVWRPTDTEAPLLRDALVALELRRRALEAAEPSVLEALVVPADRARAMGAPELVAWRQVTHRRYQAKAWYLRTERDQVLVTEVFRMEGDTPDRPVDVEGRRKLLLVREGGRLLFQGGLM